MNSLLDQVDFYFRDDGLRNTWICINDGDEFIPVDSNREEILDWLEVTLVDSFEVVELQNTFERILFRDESGLVLFKMRWL